MSDSCDLPMVLLPGLNGDSRVFARQLEAFPHLVVPSWVPPVTGESLAEYAQRLAPTIDPGGPCLIGGASFGGIVALEMAQHLPAVGCVLIACCRDVAGLPAALRMLRPVGALVPQSALAQAARWGEGSVAKMPGFRRRFARLLPEDRAFRRWALQALLTWQPAAHSCPLYQIHGELDATFPVASSGADCVVPEAGHLLTLTHPQAVNEYLRLVVQAAATKA